MIKKVKLGEVLDVKRGASLSGEFYSETGEKIRLTLGNFNYPSGGFKNNTSKTDIYFTGTVKPEFIMKKGDIITPLTEQVAGLLGETARIPEDDLYIQSGDIGLIVPNPELLDNSFAYYLLPSPVVKKQLGAGAQQTKIRHTSPEKIKDCEVWIPKMPYQKLAGALLDSINAKISTNNRINSELESMAKTIYDYWFTQFDFPDENGKPYRSSGGKMVWNEELKRGIPEGWEANRFDSILEILKDGTHNPPQRVENGIALLTGTMFGETFLDYSKATYVTEKDYSAIHSQYQPVEGDIIITKIGTLGNVNYLRKHDIPLTIHCNSALLHFNANYNKAFSLFLCKSELFQNRLKAVKGQSIQEFVSLEKIGSILIEIPTVNIVKKYNDIVYPMLKKMINVSIENQQLASLRDWLLPMLMNGQVGFKEVKK